MADKSYQLYFISKEIYRVVHEQLHQWKNCDSKTAECTMVLFTSENSIMEYQQMHLSGKTKWKKVGGKRKTRGGSEKKYMKNIKKK